jgi:tetratricopeptide (TPR) repeat protein
MKNIFVISVFIAVLSAVTFSQVMKIKVITVSAEPNTNVWVNDVKRGVTNSAGKLDIRLSPGKNVLRLRAGGFKEISQAILPTQTGILKIVLAKSTDEAELSFQKAETELDKEKAVELYENAIKLRPRYAEAYVGMARVLNAIVDVEAALDAIKKARKIRPIYSEASAVEGRIHSSDGEEAKAIAAYKRSIKEGNGVQPEAHTGLGILYKEKAEGFGAASEFEKEEENYLIAATELKLALNQLYGTEPVLYELLGGIYEKLAKKQEAIAVYEEYLRLFPNSDDATKFRSYVVQLRKQM